jgi:hypothetical protein
METEEVGQVETETDDEVEIDGAVEEVNDEVEAEDAEDVEIETDVM